MAPFFILCVRSMNTTGNERFQFTDVSIVGEVIVGSELWDNS